MNTQNLIAKRTEKMEQWARINFFEKNKNKIYENAKLNTEKYDNKIKEIERQSNELKEKLLALEKTKPIPLKIERKFNLENYRKRMTSKFPELSDLRCYKYTMRNVPKEHVQLLYSNSEKLGTTNYLQERYKLPPEQKYYFPETTYFLYGWKMTGLPKGGSNTDKYYGRKFAIKNCVWQKNGLAMFQKERQIPFTCGAPIICSKNLR